MFNIALQIATVPSFLRNIIRIFCIVLCMHMFVVGVQANDVDDNAFDLELGYTAISQSIDHLPGITATDHQQPQQQNLSQLFSDHHHSKKYQAGKHISIQLFLGFSDYRPSFHLSPLTIHTPAVCPAYRYLYFREINPPPPRYC